MGGQFWAGFMAALSAISLSQDFLGQELYIQIAQEHWVDSWITAPIALLVLGVSMVWSIRKSRNG